MVKHKCRKIASTSVSSKRPRISWSAAPAIFVACSLLRSIQANAQDPKPVELDLRHAWFEPTLTLSNDAVCARVLEGTRKVFSSRQPMGTVTRRRGVEFARLKPVKLEELQSEPIWEFDENTGQATGRWRPGHFVTTHGRRFHLVTRTNPGCGGACETYQLLVSRRPVRYGERWSIGEGLSATPAAPSYQILRDTEEVYYVAAIADGKLQLTRLGAAGIWERACEIVLEPQDMRSVPNAALQSAFAAVNGLEAAIGGLRRGAGDCGSLGAHWLGANRLSAALRLTLYRPWALDARDAQAFERGTSYASVVHSELTRWSLLGQSEYQAMETYRAQRGRTARELADFYARSFRWSTAESVEMAERALEAAVGSGFAFGAYGPDATVAEITAFRAAILERRPLSEIKALDVVKIPEHQYAAGGESVLNLAVTYPQALQYLLERGLDPNHANAFGKTPLMYAAQFNQLRAVELLLEHGANPNAATIWPPDDCYYTLERARMTPLHYAVRYASAELVALLITRGAVTFVKTENRGFDRTDEYPIDWLKRYTSVDAAERNSNIADDEVARLAELLRVPSDAELAPMASRLTEQAEAEYAAGSLTAAYRLLKAALHAEPRNERALSDMSLVALKLGLRGESLEAGRDLIEMSNDARRKANAWFNRGLACEPPRGWLEYNGNHYCRESLIATYLRAWTTEPSAARAQKLDELFRNDVVRSCGILRADSTLHRYHFVSAYDLDNGRYIRRIYVHHPSNQSIPEDELRWESVMEWRDNKPVIIEARVIARHELGQFGITELATETPARDLVRIGEQYCRASR